jgi:endonuclease YncB( thermonuclease family)
MKHLIALLLLSSVAYADTGESYTCKFVSALDGDTIKVNCPQNLDFDQDKTIRVFALDTPEKRLGLPGKESKGTAKCAAEAAKGRLVSEWAKSQFSEGDDVTFTPVKTKQKDPYGRIIANVTLKDGKDWAKEAIRLGYGSHYDPADESGYQKPDWCKN